ncbi:MAG: NUDIX domain-containing protein [Lachnospiraceae bacterium]|nr:NUDIX domain-containing protein [Lachnospiraceae bacterium]
MERLFVIDLKDYDENWERSLRPTVRAIIKCGDKLAMVHNKKYDYYEFSGGGIEEGENYHQALIREVKEELGLKVIPDTIKEFGSALRLSRSEKFEKTIFEQETFYFKCFVEDVVGEQTLGKREAEEGFELAFVSAEEALRKNRYDDHKEDNGGVWIERESRVLEILIKENL